MVECDSFQVLIDEVMEDDLSRDHDSEQTQLHVISAIGIVVEHVCAVDVQGSGGEGVVKFSRCSEDLKCLSNSLHRQLTSSKGLDHRRLDQSNERNRPLSRGVLDGGDHRPLLHRWATGNLAFVSVCPGFEGARIHHPPTGRPGGLWTTAR